MGLTQVNTDGVKDDAVTLAKQAAGTDGQVITYDASGNPVTVGPGTDGQVLTSTGAGSPPAFEDIPAGGAALTGSTDNTICTVTGANAIQGEANLTFDGTSLLSVHVPSATGEPAINFTNSDTGTGTGNGFGLGINDAESPYIWNRENTDLRIATNNAEKVRIGSDGKVHINRTTALDSNHINFSATKALSAGIPQNQINIGDAAAYNTTDNGGAIGFSAKFTSGGGYTTMASIEGVKRDNTDGNYNGDLVFKTRSHNGNNIERMRLNDSGLKFPSGYGIDFSATADAGSSASSISERLSDYEEGSWTPTYSNDGDYVSTAGSANKYIRVGNQVTVFGNLRSNENTAGNGAFYITSLPFASANHSNMYWCGTLMGDNGWTNTQDNMVCQVQPNSSTLRFWKNGNGNGVGNISFGGDIGIHANIMYSVTYHCA